MSDVREFLAVQDSWICDLVTHSFIHSLRTEWVTFWFYNDYNYYNDYNDNTDYNDDSDYNNYNDYNNYMTTETAI